MRLLLFAFFAMGIFLRIAFLDNVERYSLYNDEGHYLKCADAVAGGGLQYLKKLTDQFLNNAELQQYPSPLRAGYTAITAAWVKISGRLSFKTLSCVSAFFSVLSFFLLYFFTKELFGKTIALLSLLLFAVSPLNLALARRALQDSTVFFFMILALYSFYKARKNGGLFYLSLFAVSFFMAIISKESSVLLGIFFLFWLVSERFLPDKRPSAFPMIFTLALVAAGILLSYIWIAGGAENLVRVAKIVISSPVTNTYGVQNQSGSVMRPAFAFFLLSPLTFMAFIGFLVLYFRDKAGLSKISVFYLLSFFIIIYLSYCCVSKNVRHVAVLDFPVRVFAVLFIAKLFSGMKRFSFAASLASIVLIGITDLLIFQHLFLTHAIYDPFTSVLVRGWLT